MMLNEPSVQKGVSPEASGSHDLWTDLRDVLLQGTERKGLYGHLGSVVDNLYSFLRAAQWENQTVYDSINSREVTGQEYLTRWGCRIMVHPSCLPYDINIKAVFFWNEGKNRLQPMVETSEIDFAAWAKQLGENFSGGIYVDGASVYMRSADSHEPALRIMGSVTFEGVIPGLSSAGLEPKEVRRTRLALSPGRTNTDAKHAVLLALDHLFNTNCFKDSAEAPLTSSDEGAPLLRAARMELRGEMALEMQQLMEQEQIPALRQHQVSRRTIYRGEILRMSGAELARQVRRVRGIVEE